MFARFGSKHLIGSAYFGFDQSQASSANLALGILRENKNKVRPIFNFTITKYKHRINDKIETLVKCVMKKRKEKYAERMVRFCIKDDYFDDEKSKADF